MSFKRFVSYIIAIPKFIIWQLACIINNTLLIASIPWVLVRLAKYALEDPVSFQMGTHGYSTEELGEKIYDEVAPGFFLKDTEALCHKLKEWVRKGLHN